MDILEEKLSELKEISDSKEILKRVFKYIIQGIVIAIAAYIIPDIKLDFNTILMITLTGESAFAILDLVLPSIVVK